MKLRILRIPYISRIVIKRRRIFYMSYGFSDKEQGIINAAQNYAVEHGDDISNNIVP